MAANELRNYTLTLNADVDMVTETCCACGVLFALPASMNARLRKTHNSFYCPNGQSQSYTGKTDAEKLKDQLAKKEKELEAERSRTVAARAETEMARNSLRVTKGHNTRLKNRIKHGVCPANLPDKWSERRTCSYCGSLSPDAFFEAVSAGAEVMPTDKNYKAYVNDHGKMYFHHFDAEDKARFIAHVNQGTMKIGLPGHFYRRPFFMRELTALDAMKEATDVSDPE